MVKLSEDIVKAAQEAQKSWGVPAAVTLAQFGQESGWGLHMPSGSFNPFGIKAAAGQARVMARTWEVVRGHKVHIVAPFRKFSSFEEAFDEHGRLLNHAQYSHAMLIWTSSGNLSAYVTLLARTYATDPHYARSLLALIAANDLTAYNLPGHAKGTKT